jgi:ABC-type nitrate/sulfonate/bicarbonate transport system ATPase subunit
VDVVFVEQLKKYYEDGLEVIEDISLSVRQGEFVSIIGPSGCGKSTLFNLLTGLETATGGKIFINGQPPDLKKGQAAYMPQNDLLLPWRQVLDNVVIGLELAGVPKRERYLRAAPYLELFGLAGFENKYPSELSGGMRQRAAFLRTVLTGRDILLLDEPFAALDALTRQKMQEWLQNIWSGFRQTVLFITHDIDEAIFLSDRIFVLSARPARLISVTEIPLPRPRTVYHTLSPSFLESKEAVLSMLRADSETREFAASG